MFNTRSVLKKKTTCAVTGGKFLPPTTKYYNFESNRTILMKFGGLVGNMVRKRTVLEIHFNPTRDLEIQGHVKSSLF